MAISFCAQHWTNRPEQDFNQLELKGVIQRFEYTFELAWKTLKDYLEHSGIVLSQITPKSVIKAALPRS